MGYKEKFHSCEACMEALNNHVRFVLGRTNSSDIIELKLVSIKLV